MKIKGVLVDAVKNTYGIAEIEDCLEEFYRMLNCTTIDVARRTIDGIPVSIVCDDEGLLKDKPKLSAINGKREPMLVGSLFIISEKNDNGAFVGLSDSECEKIIEYIALIPTSMFDEPHPVVFQVEF